MAGSILFVTWFQYKSVTSINALGPFCMVVWNRLPNEGQGAVAASVYIFTHPVHLSSIGSFSDVTTAKSSLATIRDFRISTCRHWCVCVCVCVFVCVCVCAGVPLIHSAQNSRQGLLVISPVKCALRKFPNTDAVPTHAPFSPEFFLENGVFPKTQHRIAREMQHPPTSFVL